MTRALHADPPEDAITAPARDFTFRRIAVPDVQDGPRIRVQIDPDEQAQLLALRPAVPPRPPAGSGLLTPESGGQVGALAWFWDHVSPARGDGAGRFVKAQAVLTTPPDGQRVPAPRMQVLQDIAQAHGPDLLRASVGTRVSPALALAVIAVESAGRPEAVSSAGAQGLMQLIPATAERFAVQNSFDAAQNIRGGIAYLDWLLREFDNDVVLALAGYNAGEGAVQRHDGVPPFAETRDYVPKVLAAWLVARGLCTTLPELPSDGCVFRVGQAG
ncbi:MAG: lytic transglycosylase domain-containing protein [Rhodobacteraceae bacterium]|nr:lytic transglycosylase domain-containing protein [Paracoccaceae bacterium]